MFRIRSLIITVPILSIVLLLLQLSSWSTTPILAQTPPPFSEGEVFAGVGGGTVKRFAPDGTLIQTLNTQSNSNEQTGMCFDSVGTLYTTNFTAQTMTKFDNQGNVLVYPWGGPFSTYPESCVLDADGNIYTGEVDGQNLLRKFDPSGNLLATYDVALEDRGVDWIDLAADQCTMYYTSEGGRVKRYDVCTNTQLSDLATGLNEPCYSLRIRPNGEVIVACQELAYRLSPAGSQIQTYPRSAYGETSPFFAMNLDPDGETFWTAGLVSGQIYRINIETGDLVSSFNAGLVGPTVAGLAVVGEVGATLTDTDGDGLYDVWETQGIDTDGDGDVDVDLPAMGADPNKKDIFVEVDWMVGDGHSHAPKPEAIQKIVQSFANSPVDGGQGINLHVDAGPSSINHVTGQPWGALSGGNEIPHQDVIGQNEPLSEAINALAAAYFTPERSQVFHYSIFGHNYAKNMQATCSSGTSPGYNATQNFLVTLGCFDKQVGTDGEQAGTFMHELGHNFGLYHEGDQREEGFNFKPNYLSVMNYSFQMGGLIINESDGYYDYSKFDLPDLNETALSEQDGLNDDRINNYGTKYHITFPYLCWPDSLQLINFTAVTTANGPINWDCDVGIDTDPVQEDVNNEGGDAQILSSYDDWANLDYTAGSIGQAGAPPPIVITEEDINNAPVELTHEESLQIQQVSTPRVQLSKAADPETVDEGGSVTYIIAFANIDASSAEEVMITDTLPEGFSYQPGSTTGATTADPIINGQDLTWGPFSVPATSNSVVLSFSAWASSVPGTYLNNVTGESVNGIVVPALDAAPVQVGDPTALTIQGLKVGAPSALPLVMVISLLVGCIGITIAIRRRSHG